MAISKATVKKMLKEAGAWRVSESAALELTRHLNKYAYSIAAKAVKLSAHAKRKTVEKSDVELAK
ncbi:MAG: NFYB/HAP3 family transcription factor subunit [Candidatus Micrarchaeota archaeon]|nr:NFYB/HAP3 family transcription factor subunit [Candidatus Micrarchaeota archaeon]MDE1847216.1 NFYB/HAP3 family transcription factor subunit [Candidatus Micrarchaeota archaeon]